MLRIENFKRNWVLRSWRKGLRIIKIIDKRKIEIESILIIGMDWEFGKEKIIKNIKLQIFPYMKIWIGKIVRK